VQIQRKVQRNWREGLQGRWLNYYELMKFVTGVSKMLGISAQTIQNVVEQFVKSRDQWRKCPRFRKSGDPKRSLGWVPFQKQSRSVTPSSVTYLKHEMRFFGAKRRPLPSTAKGGGFVEDARSNWYVYFHVEVEDNLPQAPDIAIGIDLGLKTLATLSSGEKKEAPRIYRLWEEKLASAQRAHKLDLARAINAKIANKHRDDMHKWTNGIVRRHRTIFIGNVNASRLAKTSMAKSIYDAGWTSTRHALCYKASRHRGTCHVLDEKFSTQICSSCSTLPPGRPKGSAGLGIREWDCSNCGAHHDRDVNAARNILAFGLSAQPLAEGSRIAYGRQPDSTPQDGRVEGIS
jgi:transposase